MRKESVGLPVALNALRVWAAVIVPALLIEAAFSVVAPLGIRFFLDRLIAARDPRLLYLLLIVVVAGLALALSVGALRDFLVARARSRWLRDLRQWMFESAQGLALAFQSRGEPPNAPSRTAALLDRFSSDVAVIENAVALAISWGILPVMEALVAAGFMLWLDWRLGLVVCLLGPWILAAPGATGGRIVRAAEEREKHERGLLGTVRESLAAQAVIRAFSLESMGVTGFSRRNDLLSRSILREGLLSAFTERLSRAGILTVQTFVLVLGMWLTFTRQLTPGTLVALQMLAVVLSGNLLRVAEYLPSVAEARAAWRRIGDAINAPRSVADRPDARFLPPIQTEILFSHVDFSYDGERRDLKDIKARIPRGSYTAFVGPSGAGKSTLLHLLMRLHDPSAGFITIDGHDLKSVTQSSLRLHMGAVLQESSIFQISVRENIRVGRPEVSDTSVVEIARSVGLHDAVMAMPEGYDTVLGEHGTRLSIADMQRLAIARAILRDPEILLLDEATSALDPVDEIEVSRTLRGLAGNRTVIAATHRLSTVADADHIFVLDDGAIVEQGSHYELLAAGGAYANLWRKQAGFTFSMDGRHVDVDARRLTAFPILGRLDEAKLAELAPFFATETFAPGREIVRQNDPGDKFYIIARGKVEVWRTEERSGQTASLAILQDGDFFGEITLITGFPRTATVRARTLCTCISLERGQFNRMMDRFPELRKNLSEIALQRLRESSKAIAASALL